MAAEADRKFLRQLNLEIKESFPTHKSEKNSDSQQND